MGTLWRWACHSVLSITRTTETSMHAPRHLVLTTQRGRRSLYSCFTKGETEAETPVLRSSLAK